MEKNDIKRLLKRKKSAPRTFKDGSLYKQIEAAKVDYDETKPMKKVVLPRQLYLELKEVCIQQDTSIENPILVEEEK